jgi:hypothetical protein
MPQIYRKIPMCADKEPFFCLASEKRVRIQLSSAKTSNVKNSKILRYYIYQLQRGWGWGWGWGWGRGMGNGEWGWGWGMEWNGMD